MARYQRVADSIRERIAQGLLSVGDQLPTEPELANEYALSRLTVRRALDVLQAEGLIEKFHGRGSFVRRPPRRVTYVSRCGVQLDQPTDGVEIENYVKPSSVLAEAPVASLMQVEPGTELAEYLYIAMRDREPYGLARIYVPLELSNLLTASTGHVPWGAEICQGLKAAGVRLARISERVVSRLPSQDEAESLNLAAGATVLVIERTAVDDQGRVAEGAHLVMPGDRVEVVFSTALAEPAGR
ncbi:GntR family transcriptional regulator [Streptomyces daqingensis]|uniref:GntR family transcriptional regulator n=1 Tax=Streptomyces daqingensis TaxID=1472640 RepID=A0ABQ2MVW8_9ACTN|nr:GntR family transcriptional regulator [Streptomyces daqingensis]